MNDKLWGPLQASGVRSSRLSKAESGSKGEAAPEAAGVWEKQSPRQPLGGPLALLSPEMERTCLERAAGPEPGHLDGDAGVARGEPDTLAAEFTHLFRRSAGGPLCTWPLLAAKVTELVAVSSISLPDRTGEGKTTHTVGTCVQESSGGDSWLSQFQRVAICQRFCFGGYKPRGAPGPSVY